MSLPDEKIYPHATGLAAETVAKHQELVFHAAWFCPFVQRVWITLEEKGIPYRYKEVNPYKKEKRFLDINPRGLVPAIEYKGRPLYESLILCEFLEEEFPTSGPHLLPDDPTERAYARIWIDHISKNFLGSFMRLIQAQQKDKQDVARDDLYKAIRLFSEQIKGPYFLGDQFSLVDAVTAPWIMRDHIIQEERGYKREAASEVWAKYAAHIEKRDSVLKTTSDKEHYFDIYSRYLRDEAQNEVAKPVRTGKART